MGSEMCIRDSAEADAEAVAEAVLAEAWGELRAAEVGGEYLAAWRRSAVERYPLRALAQAVRYAVLPELHTQLQGLLPLHAN